MKEAHAYHRQLDQWFLRIPQALIQHNAPAYPMCNGLTITPLFYFSMRRIKIQDQKLFGQSVFLVGRFNIDFIGPVKNSSGLIIDGKIISLPR